MNLNFIGQYLYIPNFCSNFAAAKFWEANRGEKVVAAMEDSAYARGRWDGDSGIAADGSSKRALCTLATHGGAE